MTLREALRLRIPRVRAPLWMEGTYLRLPLLVTGGHGPWAELYDEPAQLSLKIRPGGQRILMVAHNLDLDANYEVYTGPVNTNEQDPKNFARTYAES